MVKCTIFTPNDMVRLPLNLALNVRFSSAVYVVRVQRAGVCQLVGECTDRAYSNPVLTGVVDS